jgi:hypothetical protein
MRRIFVVILCLIAQTVLCQSTFTFLEKGLTPSQVSTKVNELSKTELQQQTLSWIRKNYKYATTQVDGESILFTDVKGNFIEVKKSYYNVKYSVKIRFEKGQFTFAPITVFTKLNSKYDMGWQPFDLKDGAAFFKRGKPIKKTKVYVKKIPDLFNEMNEGLYKALNSK